MKTIEEIRHARLLQLLDSPEYRTLQALAEALDRSPAQVSQWKNRSKRKGGGLCNIDNDSARNIEVKTSKPRGWMDNDPVHDQRVLSSMGQTVAGWLDHQLPEDKRNKAFWIIHQMVFADEWPASSSTPLPRSPDVPSSEPSVALAPSPHR